LAGERDTILFSAVLGFVGGVALRSFEVLGNYFIYFLIFLSLIVFLVYFIKIVENPRVLILGFFILGFGIGILRLELSDLNKGDLSLRMEENKEVTIKGKIVDEADQREFNTKFIVKVEKTRILVTTERTSSFKYGDIVEVKGKLTKPKEFETDNGRVFDYKNYLRKDGIFFEIKNAKVTKLESGGISLRGILFELKDFLLSKIEKSIPEPESSLASGLLLGAKKSIGEDLRNDFIRTGTIHIVALSGYNVTIVAENIMRVFGRILARTASTMLGIFSIILFAIMTGAGATVVRASVMAIIALIARVTGRVSDIGRALVIAGTAMIIWNPWILIFDISFQLSFIATVGLIYLTPKIKHWFYFLPKTFGIQELVSATVATNIFVLPFILYKMGILSIVALPANILVLPFIPVTMLFIFFAMSLESIFHPFSIPFSYIAYGLLHYELFVISSLSKLSFAAVNVSEFPFIIIVIIYVFFAWWIFYKPKFVHDTIGIRLQAN